MEKKKVVTYEGLLKHNENTKRGILCRLGFHSWRYPSSFLPVQTEKGKSLTVVKVCIKCRLTHILGVAHTYETPNDGSK